MLFWGKLKQNCLYKQNNLVTKECYTVELGGPESSGFIYWKIKGTILKLFVRGWVGGWSSERNSEKVKELVNKSECTNEWINGECMLVGRKEEGRNKNLTFRGPCIVIYSYNKNQQVAVFLNFILIKNSTCFRHNCCLSSGVLILYLQQLIFVILVMLTVC